MLVSFGMVALFQSIPIDITVGFLRLIELNIEQYKVKRAVKFNKVAYGSK